MAAGISSAGQMAELIALARRRIGQVLLPAVLTGSLGVMAGSLMPAKYKAETSMELATVPPPLVDAGLTQNRLSDRMKAAETVLKTFDRMNKVLTTLEWAHYETLPPEERREFVKKFNKDIWVTTHAPPSTQLLFMQFGCYDTDPQRAAQFANALRDYFVRDLIETATEEARDRFARSTKDFKAAEEDFEAASQRLQDLRKQHKISPTQNFGSSAIEREADPLYAELQREYSELLVIGKTIETNEAELAELRKKRESLPMMVTQSETEIGGGDHSKRVYTLRERIQDAQQSQIGLKPAHSDFRKAASDIREYERQIALLEARSSDPTLVVNEKPNPERVAIDGQIADVELILTRSKAQQAVVRRNIEELEPRVAERTEVFAEFQKETDNYEQVRLRRMHLYATLETQRRLVDNLALPDFSPFDINQEALPATKPSSPSALFVVAGGLVLGLALGILYVLVAEFGRNAYRGPSELARALPAPVLGAINEIVTVEERRRRAFRAGLVGAATLILSGSLLWVTWAFHTRPGLLGPELTSWLDEMRGQLR